MESGALAAFTSCPFKNNIATQVEVPLSAATSGYN